MLVRGCAGGDLRHSLAERTKALAARCHALAGGGARSPARPDRSAERRRPRHRKSQTRWYVKVSCVVFLLRDIVIKSELCRGTFPEPLDKSPFEC